MQILKDLKIAAIVLGSIAGTFLIPVIIFLSISLNTYSYTNNIANNGVATTATLTDYYESMVINYDSYYTMEYSFEVDGQTHYGKTQGVYDYAEVFKHYKGEPIEILYTENFDSMEANFEYSFFGDVFGILSIVFFSVNTMLWAGFTIVMLNHKKYKNIFTNGNAIKATYIKSNLSINGYNGARYGIQYSYTDNNGNIKYKNSYPSFTREQALMFEQAKTFNILEFNGKTAIKDVPNQAKPVTPDNSSQPTNKRVKPTITNYENPNFDPNAQTLTEKVDSTHTKTKTHCPFCGAKLKKKYVCHSCGANF